MLNVIIFTMGITMQFKQCGMLVVSGGMIGIPVFEISSSLVKVPMGPGVILLMVKNMLLLWHV